MFESQTNQLSEGLKHLYSEIQVISEERSINIRFLFAQFNVVVETKKWT